MAELDKSTNGVSLTSLEPTAGHRLVGQAGEDIVAGDACRVHSDGTFKKSSGASANANANVHGFALRSAKSGEDLTLVTDGERLNYGDALTPGASYYLSGTVAGGLADAASTGGTEPIAFAVDTNRIQIVIGKLR